MIKHGFQGALRSTIVLSRSGLRMTPAPFLRILKQASHQVPTCQMGTHRRKDPIEPLNSPQRARDFIYSLHAKERTCLLQELQTFESIAIAQDTGAPEEQGSREETSETVEPSLPTSAQIRYVVLHNAIPFVGFGFLDNAIMIAAGTQIEMSIGITFGISTMAAAALGNLVSDLAGLGLAGYVEALASRLGMHGPDLTPKQADMWQTRVSSHLGKGIGVTIGCILGMFPLFFLGDDDDDDEEKKKKAALQPASTSSPS